MTNSPQPQDVWQCCLCGTPTHPPTDPAFSALDSLICYRGCRSGLPPAGTQVAHVLAAAGAYSEAIAALCALAAARRSQRWTAALGAGPAAIQRGAVRQERHQKP